MDPFSLGREESVLEIPLDPSKCLVNQNFTPYYSLVRRAQVRMCRMLDEKMFESSLVEVTTLVEVTVLEVTVLTLVCLKSLSLP